MKAEVPTDSHKLRPSQRCARLVAVHVPLLHKSSIAKPRKSSNRLWSSPLKFGFTLQWLRGNSVTDVGYDGETAMYRDLETCDLHGIQIYICR